MENDRGRAAHSWGQHWHLGAMGLRGRRGCASAWRILQPV